MPTSADRKSLAHQARIAFRLAGYNRQGGKANRRQQMERACVVCDWVQRHCQVHHLGQLGGRQVVASAVWRGLRGDVDRAAVGLGQPAVSVHLALHAIPVPVQPVAVIMRSRPP